MPAARREITVGEAVKLLPGISNANLQKWLRDAYLLKAQPCPFGNAVWSEGGKWCYYVYPQRLNAYINASDMRVFAPTETERME
jgi:hypothetical protein